MNDYTKLGSSTIGTLFSRLVKKGALKYEKDCRVFVYTPLIEESEILEKESDTFLNRFYDGALTRFFRHGELTERLSPLGRGGEYGGGYRRGSRIHIRYGVASGLLAIGRPFRAGKLSFLSALA